MHILLKVSIYSINSKSRFNAKKLCKFHTIIFFKHIFQYKSMLIVGVFLKLNIWTWELYAFSQKTIFLPPIF